MPLGADLPIRRSGTHVRRQSIRRASAPHIGLAQIYALILMLMCLAAVVSLGNSSMFAARRLEIHGATFTGETVVRDIVRLDSHPNLFRMRTDRITSELEALPAVESAQVDVRLPDTIVVTLIEREPRLIWVIGSHRYVVDSSGLMFGEVDVVGNPIEPVDAQPAATPEATTPEGSPEPTVAEPSEISSPLPPDPGTEQARDPLSTLGPAFAGRVEVGAKATVKPTPKPTPKRTATPKPTPTPTPSPTPVPRPSLAAVPPPESNDFRGPRAVAVPVLFDRRADAAELALGSYVDPISLDAGYRLAGIKPSDIGSASERLDVVLDDEHGFTMSTGADGWVAEFGFYTETLRKDTVIPIQVRDLRSALDKFGESKIAWIFLMSDVSESHINTLIMK